MRTPEPDATTAVAALMALPAAAEISSRTITVSNGIAETTRSATASPP
jgi:hypothetical protein